MPEMRRIFVAAQEYINGEISIIELNGVVMWCYDYARIAKLAPAITELLETWVEKVNQTWNEWGLYEHPLTREELCSWLRDQLLFDF